MTMRMLIAARLLLALAATICMINPAAAHNCTEVPLYLSETPWDSLDETQLAAAELIGFDEDLWSEAHEDEFPGGYDGIYYFDLSEAEQEALATLGYTMGDFEGFFEDYTWDELKEYFPEVKDALKSIGFIRVVWNSCEGECVEVEDKEWSELSTDEKTAVEVWGFTCVTWEEEG